MKNLKIFSAILLVAVLFSTACRKKAADRNFLTGKEIAPVLTLLPGSDSIKLTMDLADVQAVGMKWTAADWGFPTTYNYAVEIIKQGGDWKDAKVFNIGTKREAALTHFDLNAIANAAGILPTQSGVLSSRIKAIVPGNELAIYSNVVNRTVVAYKMDVPVITTTPSTSTIILLKDSANSKAINMDWTAVNWDNPSTTVYQLEVIRKGDAWSTAKIIPVSGTNYSITHKALNLLLLGAFATDTLATDSLSFRVKASMPGTSRMAYSEVVSKNITTYKIIFKLEKMYLPGDYQGWNHDLATVQYLEEQVIGSGKFFGTVEKTRINGTVSSGGFKMTPEANWNYDFGDNGTTYTDPKMGNGIIGPKWMGTNGLNFSLADGTYFITVDTTATNRTWSYSLENWGLIGDATNKADLNMNNTPDGWESDKNMRYNQVSKMYEITIDLEAGAVKFRKNDDWGTNYGDFGTNLSLEPSGDNIPIAVAGNYTIKMDLDGKVYTITKN